MDIEEIRTRRETLKTKLIQLVKEFEGETKICVEFVSIRHGDIPCKTPLSAYVKINLE